MLSYVEAYALDYALSQWRIVQLTRHNLSMTSYNAMAKRHFEYFGKDL